MAHLKELHEKHGKKDLVILGVHTIGAANKAPAFVKDQEIPYRVAIDREAGEEMKGATAQTYKVDSFPDYYLVDRKGILRFADPENKELDRAIEYLFAEKSSDK